MGKLLLKLSVPAMTGMLVMASYNVVDTIFVGLGVGPLGLGAVASAQPIQFMVHALSMMVGVGTASLVSRSLGKGDMDKSEAAMGNGLTMALTAGLTVTVLGRFFLPFLISLTGAPQELRGFITDYLSIIFMGSPLLVSGITLNSAIRAEGKVKVAMMAMILSALTNIVLDPVFIFVFKMGVRGAAIATVIAKAVTVTWGLGHYLTGHSSIALRRRYLKLKAKVSWEIMSIGASEFARISAQSVAGLVILNRLSSHGGADAIAAQGIVQKMLSLSTMPIFGIGQGLQPIVGYAYGSDRPHRAKKAVELGLVSASVISIATSALFIAFPRPIIRIFTSDGTLMDIASKFIRIALAMYSVVGFQIIGTVTFQALGLGRPSMIMSLSRQVLFLIPLAIVLPPIFGLNGVFMIYPVADLGSAALTLWFLLRYRDRLLNHGVEIPLKEAF